MADAADAVDVADAMDTMDAVDVADAVDARMQWMRSYGTGRARFHTVLLRRAALSCNNTANTVNTTYTIKSTPTLPIATSISSTAAP